MSGVLYMAVSLIISVTAAPGANGGTSAAIDTTGANFLIASVSSYTGAGGAAAVSDNKGNTWIGLTGRAGSGAVFHRFFYAKNATVGTGHTVTLSDTGIYASLIVYAFAGLDTTAPFDVENGTGGAQPRPTGAITPASDGALIVSGFVAGDVTGISVDSGLTQTTVNYSAGNNMAGAAGWKTQTTAAAITPTWNWTGASAAAVSVAAFKAALSTLAEGRVSQAVVELLSQPVLPAARVTQAAVELLSANVAAVAVTERVDTFVWMAV